jgi:hypothetical protein
VTIGFSAEFFYEFSRAVDPATGAPLRWSDLALTGAMARGVTSPFARAYNNILALLLTFIALAVPLTANLYTPKLIDIFLRDRVNLAVLCGGAILAAHSILAATLTFDNFVSHLAFWVSCIGAMIGWTILIPYYFYVLSFLNPVTIIDRVRASLVREFHALAEGRLPIPVAQRRLNQEILNLGNVIIRAVERADRDVSVDSINALVAACVEFQKVKPRIAARFFVITEELFTGMSSAAIEIVNDARIWVEQKMLNQLALAYNAALAKMPDAVSAISDAVKDLAHLAAKAGASRETVDLHVRFLNNFMREAIKKKDIHAIYDVFYQFKSLTRRLTGEDTEWACRLLRHLRYYADFAKASGLPFIYELSSYELADLTEWAYERESEAAPQFLAAMLAFEGVESSVRLVKSRLIIGSYFFDRALGRELERVRASLARVPAAVLEQAHREIMETTDRIFWEVTDRQVNFDFVPEHRKPHISKIVETLAPSPAAAATPAKAESEA